MARPEKCKRICNVPMNKKFVCETSDDDSVFDITHIMTMEEYETIRLIDYIGLKQEECAEQMNVARTTVQRMYYEARRKIASFLISGASLEIDGGNYRICEKSSSCCEEIMCPMRKCGCTCERFPEASGE